MKNKEIFIISLTVFLTVIAWIALDIYHIVNNPDTKGMDKKYTEPISVSIDQTIFTTLEEKQ